MRQETLRQARRIAFAMSLGLFLFLGTSLIVPPFGGGPAALAPAAALAASFLNALVLGLAPTEAAALAGLVAWMFARGPLALLPFAVHRIATATTWPSRERLDRWSRGEG